MVRERSFFAPRPFFDVANCDLEISLIRRMREFFRAAGPEEDERGDPGEDEAGDGQKKKNAGLRAPGERGVRVAETDAAQNGDSPRGDCPLYFSLYLNH